MLELNGQDPKAEIHGLRQEIDRTISDAQIIRQWSKPNAVPGESTDYAREISLVITKLQEAKMWAGKCLEMLGSELPKEYQDKAEEVK